MIITSWFRDDTNITLQRVQHDLYWTVVGFIYFFAKERYLRASKLLGVETELTKKITEMNTFDQIPLFLNDLSYEEYLKEKWLDFYYKSIRDLIEDDSITLAILAAIAYENTESGYAAEDHLQTLLSWKYGDLEDRYE
jgi:hypothetical protein